MRRLAWLIGWRGVGCWWAASACMGQPSGTWDDAPTRDGPPNIVLIVADDVGRDMVGYYDYPDAPCTPRINQLAAGGVVFHNAWSTPSCSPTRAQLLTGMHPRRTGIGTIVSTQATGLQLAHRTLPEALAPVYESSLVGKWHLQGDEDSLAHPLLTGFDYAAGSIANLDDDADFPGRYDFWICNTNGQLWIERRNATTWTVNEALRRARAMAPPWFLYVPFNAVHVPTYFPPQAKCQVDGCNPSFCSLDPNTKHKPTRIRAMMESLDWHVGRLLDGIAEIDPDAVIVFIGDNGTADVAALPPLDPDRVKSTVYEGGVHVPMIISGPRFRPGETDALVTIADLYATLTELAGAPETTCDSASLVPLLRDPDAAGPHAAIVAEAFRPNFDPFTEPFAPSHYRRAVRNGRFKLIRYLEPGVYREELYDLIDDPLENVNLLPPADLEVLLHYAHLSAALEQHEAH